MRLQIPDAIGIFILPPSRDALEQRMRSRGQDSAEVIARRLAAAREEMSHYDEFDYVVVNEVFDDAVDEVGAIIAASRARRPVQQRRHAGPDRGAAPGRIRQLWERLQARMLLLKIKRIASKLAPTGQSGHKSLIPQDRACVGDRESLSSASPCL